MIRKIAAMLVAFAVCSGSIQAQWRVNGRGVDVSYNYSVTGSLSCNYAYILQPCVNNANGITLHNGSAFATITYTGYTGSLTAANFGTPAISFGTLHVAVGGTGPFTWSPMIARNASFFMDLSFTPQFPGAGTSTNRRGFIYQSPNNMASFFGEQYRSYMNVGLPSSNGALYTNYHAVVFDFNNPQLASGADGDYDLSAQISLIPEPSTYAMMLAGLAALGIVSVRRRKATSF